LYVVTPREQLIEQLDVLAEPLARSRLVQLATPIMFVRRIDRQTRAETDLSRPRDLVDGDA